MSRRETILLSIPALQQIHEYINSIASSFDFLLSKGGTPRASERNTGEARHRNCWKKVKHKVQNIRFDGTTDETRCSLMKLADWDLYIYHHIVYWQATDQLSKHENQRNVTWKIRKQCESFTCTARLRKVRFNPIRGKRVEAVSITTDIIKGIRREEERVRRAVSWKYNVDTKNIISACVLGRLNGNWWLREQ